MKTALLTAVIIAVSLPASAADKNPNYGKADDYGSQRYAAVNNCMVAAIEQKEPKAAPPNALSDCMKNSGYVFLPDARIFGNKRTEVQNRRAWHVSLVVLGQFEMTAVATIAELRRYQRRELIKNLEAILGAAESGPDHFRLRRLLRRAGIITKKRRGKS